MSSLATMSPRFQSKRTTIAQLAAMPAPVRLGPWHAPVPHIDLVSAILDEAGRRDMVPTRTELAVGGKGAAIFGVIEFESPTSGRATSLGFRNSTDSTLSMQGVAGARVFVCDNLCMSGDFDTWARKNTTGARLQDVIRAGFAKFELQGRTFEASLRRLESTPCADYTAKTLMWDVFSRGILPARFIELADSNYFEAPPEWTDCAPRTLAGVHNALTRVVHEITPTRQLEVSTAISKVFGVS